MSTSFDALGIRARLGRADWSAPRPFGPDGWMFQCITAPGAILVTAGPAPGSSEDWWHASIARPQMPTYEDLILMHRAVWWPSGWAYQVFAPPAAHVNIHEHALHLWGRPDGSPVLPNFGAGGSI